MPEIELSQIQILKIVSVILARQAERAKLLEVDCKLKKSLKSFLGTDEEKVGEQHNQITAERIDNIFDAICFHISQENPNSAYLSKFDKNGVFASYLKENVNDGSGTFPILMKYFLRCAIILDNLGMYAEGKDIILESFPPSKEELNCIPGVIERISDTMILLTASPAEKVVVEASNRIYSALIDSLKQLVSSDFEIHLTTLFNYALGLESKSVIDARDIYNFSAHKEFPSETMWNILTGYSEKLLEIISDDLKRDVEEKVEKGREAIGKYNKYKEDGTIDIDSLMKDADKRDRGAMEIRTNINNVLPPLTINDLIKYDEDTKIFSWKSDDEITHLVADSFPVVKLLQEEAEKFPVQHQQSEADLASIEAIREYKDLFRDDAVQHLSILLKSDSKESKLFAVNALWVMGEEFLCNSPIRFMNFVELICGSSSVNQSEFLENISETFSSIQEALPPEQQFKVQRIIDRYQSYAADSKISIVSGMHPPDILLHDLLRYTESGKLIIDRIKRHPDELHYLKDISLTKLVLHPQREEIFDGIKNHNIALEEDLIARLLMFTKTFVEGSFYDYLLEKFVNQDNAHLILSSRVSDEHRFSDILILYDDAQMMKHFLALCPDWIRRGNNASEALFLAMMGDYSESLITLLEDDQVRSQSHNSLWSALIDLVSDGSGIKVLNALIQKYPEDAEQYINDVVWRIFIHKNQEASEVIASALSSGLINRDKIDYITDYSKALVVAVEKNDMKSVEILCNIGIDVNVVFNGGVTPFVAAVRSGSINMAQFLLDNGANPNILSDLGHSCAKTAIINGDCNMLKFLLGNGMTINANEFSSYQTSLDQAKNKDLKDLIGSIGNLQKEIDRALGYRNFMVTAHILEDGSLKAALAPSNKEQDVSGILEGGALKNIITENMAKNIVFGHDKKIIKFNIGFDELTTELRKIPSELVGDHSATRTVGLVIKDAVKAL